MADVFSFGVLVLVTITGRKACDIINESKERLMDYVWRNWMEGTCSNIIDLRINVDGYMSSITKLIHIGLLCVQDEATDRPTMEEIVTMMIGNSSAPLPIPKRPKMEEIVAMMLGSSSGPLCIPKRQSIGICKQLKIGNFKYLDMYLYTIRGEDRILRRFDFKTIVDATENFSRANRFEGFYPSLYKGRLQNGQHITIVQYGPDASIGVYEECMFEASIYVKVEHENLLKLLGYCVEGTTVYLVYDFVPYARLDRLIFDPIHAPFDWNARYKIILGVARVLVYLHNHAPVRIIHCDVQPRNILLDENLEPKLFNFGAAICKSINDTDDFEMLMVHGTQEYIAPEVFRHHWSTTADVFSFGVLVLVTITRHKAFDIISKSSEMLKDYVKRNSIGRYLNLIDPRIIINGDWTSITKLMHIGLLCVQNEATNRPTMEEVVAMLPGSSSASH